MFAPAGEFLEAVSSVIDKLPLLIKSHQGLSFTAFIVIVNSVTLVSPLGSTTVILIVLVPVILSNEIIVKFPVVFNKSSPLTSTSNIPVVFIMEKFNSVSELSASDILSEMFSSNEIKSSFNAKLLIGSKSGFVFGTIAAPTVQ